MSNTAFASSRPTGARRKSEYRFASLRLPYEGGEITAGLAYSFAQQGVPMRAYAEKVRELYGSA